MKLNTAMKLDAWEGKVGMAGRVKKFSAMRGKHAWTPLERFGICAAAFSSILVSAGPAMASAHEAAPAYDEAGNGHFSIQLASGEVPEGGDPHGRGSATLDLKPQEGVACFTIEWSQLSDEVTALHLHAAVRGSEGPHAIDFFNNQHFPGEQNKASGCVPATREKIDSIIANPADYYLNLHSSAFPNGALRGQLN